MGNIKKASVVIVPTALAMSALTGCATNVEYHNKELDTKEIYDGIYSQFIEAINENGNEINPSNNFMEMYKIDKSNREYLHRFFDTGYLKSFDEAYNLSHLLEEIGDEDPTYEMVVGLIDQNEKLDSKEKDILKKSVLDIYKKYPNLNKSLLIMNASTLSIRHIYVEDEFYSRYNAYANTILINDKYATNADLTETAIRNASGYLYTNCYLDLYNKKILCSDTINYLNIGYMGNVGREIVEGGKTFKDGFVADITMDTIDCALYPDLAEDVYIFRLMSKMEKMSYEEYVKGGFEGIINKMRENGHNGMIRHLIRFDDPEEQYNKCYIMIDILNAYIGYLRTTQSDEDIYYEISNMLDECSRGISYPTDMAFYERTRSRDIHIWLQFMFKDAIEASKEKTR